MPEKIINLGPEVTPNTFFAQNAQDLGRVPDGTGLQIIFPINGKNYLIAGTRRGDVITVNGGKIEKPDSPFFDQITQEMDEETFGIFTVAKTERGGYQLLVKGNKKPYPLLFQPVHTFQKYQPGRYSYLTFTAVCEGFSLEQLKEIAAKMTPTARFWNRIYDHLSKPTQSTSQLVNELNAETDTVLIAPKSVLGPKGLAALDEIEDMRALKESVGRYSERPAYHVFDTEALLRAVQNASPVYDVDGARISTGVFNADVVLGVIPAVTADLKVGSLTRDLQEVKGSPAEEAGRLPAPVTRTAHGKIVELGLEATPRTFYDQNRRELSMVPDGAGIQILFAINGKQYLVANTRNDYLIPVQGGKISSNTSFLDHLSTKLAEISSGMMTLRKASEGVYQLSLKADARLHTLSIQDKQSFQMHVPQKYVYITFTAVCNSLTLDEVKRLAAAMPGFNVFEADDLLTKAPKNCSVYTIDGKKVANGVFNYEAISCIFPAIKAAKPSLGMLRPDLRKDLKDSPANEAGRPSRDGMFGGSVSQALGTTEVPGSARGLDNTA